MIKRRHQNLWGGGSIGTGMNPTDEVPADRGEGEDKNPSRYPVIIKNIHQWGKTHGGLCD